MPVHRPSPSTVGLAALAVVVLLSGCDASSEVGDPPGAAAPEQSMTAPPATGEETMAPTQVPTPTLQPTPASSDAPAANLPVPVRPDLADELSADGLEAFTAHWLALLSYSYEADDLEPLLAVSDPACRFCAETEESMEQIYRMAWALGGTTTLTSFRTDFTPDAGGIYTADLTTTQAEIFYFSGEGWLGSSESKPDTPHTLTARYLDGEWQSVEYTTPTSAPPATPPAG